MHMALEEGPEHARLVAHPTLLVAQHPAQCAALLSAPLMLGVSPLCFSPSHSMMRPLYQAVSSGQYTWSDQPTSCAPVGGSSPAAGEGCLGAAAGAAAPGLLLRPALVLTPVGVSGWRLLPVGGVLLPPSACGAPAGCSLAAAGAAVPGAGAGGAAGLVVVDTGHLFSCASLLATVGFLAAGKCNQAWGHNQQRVGNPSELLPTCMGACLLLAWPALQALGQRRLKWCAASHLEGWPSSWCGQYRGNDLCLSSRTLRLPVYHCASTATVDHRTPIQAT
jgi:hypothetical protein